jgi:hypothetical protein
MYIFVHYTCRSLSLYAFIGCRQLRRMLAYRFRLYPSRGTERKLERHLELCLWLYNRLLSELNSAREKGVNLRQTDTQAPEEAGEAGAERGLFEGPPDGQPSTLV